MLAVSFEWYSTGMSLSSSKTLHQKQKSDVTNTKTGGTEEKQGVTRQRGVPGQDRSKKLGVSHIHTLRVQAGH